MYSSEHLGTSASLLPASKECIPAACALIAMRRKARLAWSALWLFQSESCKAACKASSSTAAGLLAKTSLYSQPPSRLPSASSGSPDSAHKAPPEPTSEADISLWSRGEMKKSIAASCSSSIRQCLPPISPVTHCWMARLDFGLKRHHSCFGASRPFTRVAFSGKADETVDALACTFLCWDCCCQREYHCRKASEFSPVCTDPKAQLTSHSHPGLSRVTSFTSFTAMAAVRSS
mmetsp:Transcript_16812/g.37192  ORF Transcript_16812/g.37192 Transcript_16812/m.37192 type:complete len:233 (+) Transcript_16812:2057-2755(+)